ncbi:MAG: T9SS type A sorting domain-containing protein, partial [Bacteroidales bacterium]|nr:T9SS type A sorting domain-containing protein [Bacteroidales bacterium]
QEPLKTSVKIINHDRDYSMVESQRPDGNFYRPIKSGAYTIEITAEGYIPKREDVVVTDNEKTIVEIHLERHDDALGEYDDVDFKIDASGETLYINNKLLKTIRFELINIHGQIVKKDCFNEENMELKLSELNGGVYFLNIIIGDKQMVRKIVVR